MMGIEITEDERRVLYDLVRVMGGQDGKSIQEILTELVADGKITPITEREIEGLSRKLEGHRPVDPRTV